MQFLLHQLKTVATYMTILSLYTVFFMVQIFNSSAAIGSDGSRLSFITTKTAAKEKTLTSKPSHEKKSGIRLNKRFHPENITSINYFIERPVLIIAGRVSHNKPKDYLLISSILSDSLRGPPVVC